MAAMMARSGSQSIERALAVLACFERAESQSVADVSRALDLSPPTAHRVLRALVRGRLLAQDATTSRYTLGVGAVALGGLASRRLGFEGARGELAALAAEVGEAVTLGVSDGLNSLVVLSVPSPHDGGIPVFPGERAASYACAMGKTIAAFGGGELASRSDWTAFTVHTITDPAGLGLELADIRKRGWALNKEELAIGTRGVAAPIHDAGGSVVAAVAIAAPASRLRTERSIQGAATAARAAARRLDATLVVS